jgi:di/tricarboxylate transporter
MVLASIIPSNGARSGGVILPIARSIARLYGSEPGETAGRLGGYLMTAVYQSICVTAAMFFPGQVSNVLAAQMATAAGYPVNWTSWLVAVIFAVVWLSWVTVLALTLAVYFYAHYDFVSITAHMLAMYPPFLALLVSRGAPMGLVVYSFACFANLAAGLTHYGTTPSPMFFAQDYVPLRTWWRVGFVMSLVNIGIWTTVGFGWWKLVGIW